MQSKSGGLYQGYGRAQHYAALAMVLGGIVFVSYAPEDSSRAALQIADRLSQEPSSIQSWIAERDIVDTEAALDEVTHAVQKSACFLLLLTRGASRQESRASHEWKLALRYKKPIVIAVLDNSVLPPHLARRTQVNIDLERDNELQALRNAILKTATTEGLLDTAQQYLEDAKLARRYARSDRIARIDADIVDQRRLVQSLSEAISNPAGVRDRLDQRIRLGVETERVPQRETEAQAEVKTAFINAPPVNAPGYFQNRFVETGIICDFVRDEAKRLLVVTGRGGVGKSALVCRVLRGLERGVLPDDRGDLQAAGIVYLSYIAQRRPSFDNLFADLLRLLPSNARQRVQSIGGREAPLMLKTRELLSEFSVRSVSGPTIVLLDNMENAIDPITFQINDDEIAVFLRQLINSTDCALKIIITSRIMPRDFSAISPNTQSYLPLDEGLGSPYAENVFRALDSAGIFGLNTASDFILGRLREYTRGFPRAIEAVFMMLAADRDTTIEDILKAPAPNEGVVRVLVGEAFSRLDYTDQLVMQALAIFGQPVPATAIDYVLQPWLLHIDAGLSLGRLVNMLFVRKEGRHYYLHPVDRQHALRILQEEAASVTSRFTVAPSDFISNQELCLKSLKEQAAEYFADIQIERSEWQNVGDIDPFVFQFRLRI